MTDPLHLIESEYAKTFPAAVDEFPAVADDEHYIDAWLFNSLFSSLAAIEQYLIDHRSSIDAPAGDDIIGEAGSLLISIPPGLYPAYKFAMAWDPELLAENIKSGETIFGVTGAVTPAMGVPQISEPILSISGSPTPPNWPPWASMDTSVPVISAPITSIS